MGMVGIERMVSLIKDAIIITTNSDAEKVIHTDWLK